MGVQHADISRKLNAVQLAFKSAFVAEREFTTGKVDSKSRISLALARRSATEATAVGADNKLEV